MIRTAILFNPHSGRGQKEEEIKRIVERYGEAVFLIPFEKSENIDEAVKTASEHGVATIIAVGGDGTVSSVASAIVRLKLPLRLGVVPSGTFNHFAKDIGIPLEMEKAFEIALSGQTKLVDIAAVNDIYFINNSSLGIYPEIVKEREGLEKKGLSKKKAFLVTLYSVFKKLPKITISFDAGNSSISKKTSFIFIGNNKYSLDGLAIGSRNNLDQGILSVFMAHNIGKFEMLSLGIKAALGNIAEEKSFDTAGLRECIIKITPPEILVSHDGEISRMKGPLKYKIHSLALQVIIPSHL